MVFRELMVMRLITLVAIRRRRLLALVVLIMIVTLGLLVLMMNIFPAVQPATKEHVIVAAIILFAIRRLLALTVKFKEDVLLTIAILYLIPVITPFKNLNSFL